MKSADMDYVVTMNPFDTVQSVARHRRASTVTVKRPDDEEIKAMFDARPADEAFRLAQQIMAETVRRSQEITHRRPL